MEAFVIRVWTPEDVESPPDGSLHGVVLHIGSGRSMPFRSAEELTAFVTSSLSHWGPPEPSPLE